MFRGEGVKSGFLEVFVEDTVNPDDAANDDESHRGENHQAVVDVAEGVESVGDDLKSEESAASEEFAEEGDGDEYDCVADAVAYSVEERGPWFVCHGKGFEATHQDAVGDDESDEDGELLGDVVGVGFEELVDDYHKSGHYNELYDDADIGWDCVSDERYDDV